MPARLTVGHGAGAAPATRATSWALAVPRVPAPPVQAGTPSPGQPLPLQTGQDDSRAVGEVCFDITPLVCPAYLLAEGTSVCEWDGAQQGNWEAPQRACESGEGVLQLPSWGGSPVTNPHGCFHLVGPAKATPAPSSGGGSQRAWGPSRCPHRADRAASSAKPPGWARKRI